MNIESFLTNESILLLFKMKEHKLKVPYTGKERRVRVLLPKHYEKDTDRSYPVVYFHDGQNVFIVRSPSLPFMEDYPSY